jgi:hypothetical protein
MQQDNTIFFMERIFLLMQSEWWKGIPDTLLSIFLIAGIIAAVVFGLYARTRKILQDSSAVKNHPNNTESYIPDEEFAQNLLEKKRARDEQKDWQKNESCIPKLKSQTHKDESIWEDVLDK